MQAKDRLNAIMDYLQKNDIIKISDITKKFDVSFETARRDLISLQDKGLVSRVNGGAIINHSKKNSSLPRFSNHFPEKQAITNAAAELVHNGETIFLDAGTTMQLLARSLKSHRYLTIITYSLMVVEELKNTENQIIMLGGNLMPDEQVFYSQETEEAMKQYFVDKSFVSCMGASMKDGITDLPYTISRTLLRDHSDQMIIIADSSKWGTRSKRYMCPLTVMDTFVVDSHLDESSISELKALGKEVIIAPVDDSTTTED